MTATATLVSASQDGAIDLAVEKLLLGDVVAVPTETVYGLAADATNDDAVSKIYAVKGRPSFNPLICHVSDATMAGHYVELSEAAEKLMSHHWPGPLTIVSKRKIDAPVSPTVTAGLETLAVRCPDNNITQGIIEKLGRPIAAPSANPSGQLSPTNAQSVLSSLGSKIPLVIDDGPTRVGIESTIIAVEQDKLTLLRPGTITVDEISATTDLQVRDRQNNKITAPGQLSSHYAPTAQVRLNGNSSNSDIFIGFGNVDGDFNLSASGDLHEAARNLFEVLRTADETGAAAIAVAPIPNEGVGIAINDRLKRAAAPRPETSDD